MFRITKVLENGGTIILKVEGTISQSEEDDWAEAWKSLELNSAKKQVVDLCGVHHITAAGLETLRRYLRKDVILLNSSVYISAALQGQKR